MSLVGLPSRKGGQSDVIDSSRELGANGFVVVSSLSLSFEAYFVVFTQLGATTQGCNDADRNDKVSATSRERRERDSHLPNRKRKESRVLHSSSIFYIYTL